MAVYNPTIPLYKEIVMTIEHKQVVIDTLPAEISWDNTATPYNALREKLESVGLEDYCPAPYSATEALEATLKDYGRRWRKQEREDPQGGDVKFNVQGHKNRKENGFQFNKVIAQKRQNPNIPLFSAQVGDGEVIYVTGHGGHEFQGHYLVDLMLPYNKYRETCSATRVGQALKRIVYERYNGTSAKSSGGTYFIANEFVEEFDTVVRPIFESFGNLVHVSRVVLDANQIRKVMICLTDELLADIQKLEADIAENDYRRDTLVRRKAQAESIRRKAEFYEPVLDQQLTAVREALATAEEAFSQAFAAEEHTEVLSVVQPDDDIFSFAS